MAVSVADQCVAKFGLNVPTGGVPAAYSYGDVLPAASTPADLAARAALRGGGLLRAVTAATLAADFSTAAIAAATQAAANEAASTSTTAAKPVLVCAGSLPVVANY